jgi:2-methylcitrate dehydratase PrpD
MTSNIDAIVAHGLNTQFEDIPERVVEKVKVFLLDSLGVGVAGAGAPLTSVVRDCAAIWGKGDGAHTWGRGGSLQSAANAAFVNAFQIHCQEYDCVHEPAVVHPMAVILAAVMAEIESCKNIVDGKSLTVALTVAIDLAAGLGVAVSSPIRFFRPANAGLFGAVLAISRLRALSPVETKSALGHALAFCSGTMQAHIEGMPSLALQVANGARSAIMAVDLAAVGIPGAQDSLEGPYGYLNLFEEAADLGPIVTTLGTTWRIAEVSHKPFPTGRAAQGGIVLIQQLMDKGVTADNLESLKLLAPPIIHRLVGRPVHQEMSISYARLCFQYVGAVTLMKGSIGLDDYSVPALTNTETLALGKRISVIDDGTANPAAFTPQRAEAVLKDGHVVTAEISSLYGSPASPMEREAHILKFKTCLKFGFGTEAGDVADKLIELTDRLETIEDTSQLSRLAAGKDIQI